MEKKYGKKKEIVVLIIIHFPFIELFNVKKINLTAPNALIYYFI